MENEIENGFLCILVNKKLTIDDCKRRYVVANDLKVKNEFDPIPFDECSGCKQGHELYFDGDAELNKYIKELTVIKKKKCSKCGVEKEHKMFNVHPRTADGLYKMCRECHVKKTISGKKKHPKPLKVKKENKKDIINRLKHDNLNPYDVERIGIIEHLNFCRGSAIKYIWRAGLKENEIDDLKKARWFIEREIKRIENEK